MDADLTSCKHVSTGKQVKPCSSLCLQEIAYDFNVGKCSGQECSNPVNGRPKRIGTKIKSGMLTIQGPPASGFDGDTIKKPTSKEKNLLIVGENGLKKGTWKRAQIKPRSGMDLPLNILLGQKRSSKDISCVIEKAELAKKKTKLFAKPRKKRMGKVFRFESKWLKDPRREAIVEEAWDEGLLAGSGDVLNKCLENCRARLEVWNGTEFDGRLLLQWAMQYLEEYRTAVDLIPIAQVSVQHVQRWIPPPVPGFKFNVDGAAFAELNFVGV
nr:hypothetical protein CFP56_29743 [Quercus suber]